MELHTLVASNICVLSGQQRSVLIARWGGGKRDNRFRDEDTTAFRLYKLGFADWHTARRKEIAIF